MQVNTQLLSHVQIFQDSNPSLVNEINQVEKKNIHLVIPNT